LTPSKEWTSATAGILRKEVYGVMEYDIDEITRSLFIACLFKKKSSNILYDYSPKELKSKTIASGCTFLYLIYLLYL
jgi:hypothetical protein